MKNLHALSIALTFFVASASTVAAEEQFHSEKTVKADEKGNYKAEVKSEATDSAGTTTEHKDELSAKTTLTGKRKVESTSETKTDPRGLLNSTTDKEAVTETLDKDGNYSKTAKSKSVDSAGTARVNQKSTEVEVQPNGNEKTTVTEKHEEDPKGLFNKTTSESKTVK